MGQFCKGQFCKPLVAAAVLAAACGTAQSQQTVNLKMQATWPASLTLYENFTYFVERVGKISAGTLKIDAMPAGRGGAPLEGLGPPHKKGIAGAHPWAGYLGGKSKAAIPCTGGPRRAPCRGPSVPRGGGAPPRRR